MEQTAEEMIKEIDEQTYGASSFRVLKSGNFKGKLSSRWFRKNNGQVILTCPKCGGTLPGTCGCGWIKDVSGFRYRYINK